MAEPVRSIAITRVFEAPPERVWREWTEPERFADWFGGPEAEIPLSTVTMDVRAGGAWRLTMFAGPARHEIHWWGEYREVAEPERLVFTLSDAAGRSTRSTSSPCCWPTSATAAPRCASSSAGACRRRRSTPRAPAGATSSTGSPSGWPPRRLRSVRRLG